VALVYEQQEARLAAKRLNDLVERWREQFGAGDPFELHCPSWLRDWEHGSGFTRADRHAMMEEFLLTVADCGGRLLSVVLDKRENQPSKVAGKSQVFVWHRLFEEVLCRGGYEPHDRVEWRLDGARHPHSGSGARLVRGTCREACGVEPEVCSLPPCYVDSKSEILIQAADAAAHLLYQSIVPSKSHLDLELPFDISILDGLCREGVQQNAFYVRLPSA